MKEVGDRTAFEFGQLRDRQRDYFDWGCGPRCGRHQPEDVLTEEAAILLAAKFKISLQIGRPLVRAFEAGFEASVKAIEGATVDDVLLRRIDDFELQFAMTSAASPSSSMRSRSRSEICSAARSSRFVLGELTDEMRTARPPL